MITSILSTLSLLHPETPFWAGVPTPLALALFGFYYGLLTSFPVGLSHLTFVRTYLMEGELAGKVALSGLMVGQSFFLLSLQSPFLYAIWMRPYVWTLFMMPIVLMYWRHNTSYKFSVDSINLGRNYSYPLGVFFNGRVQSIFLTTLLFHVLNPIVLNPVSIRLMTLFLYRYSRNKVFLLGLIVGCASSQGLFWLSTKFLRYRLEMDSPFVYSMIKRLLHRTLSVITFVFFLMVACKTMPAVSLNRVFITNIFKISPNPEDSTNNIDQYLVDPGWPDKWFDKQIPNRPFRVTNKVWPHQEGVPVMSHFSQYFFQPYRDNTGLRLIHNAIERETLDQQLENINLHHNLETSVVTNSNFQDSKKSSFPLIDASFKRRDYQKERKRRLMDSLAKRVEALDKGKPLQYVIEKTVRSSSIGGDQVSLAQDPRILQRKRKVSFSILPSSSYVVVEDTRRLSRQIVKTSAKNKAMSWLSEKQKIFSNKIPLFPWQPLTRIERDWLYNELQIERTTNRFERSYLTFERALHQLILLDSSQPDKTYSVTTSIVFPHKNVLPQRLASITESLNSLFKTRLAVDQENRFLFSYKTFPFWHEQVNAIFTAFQNALARVTVRRPKRVPREMRFPLIGSFLPQKSKRRRRALLYRQEISHLSHFVTSFKLKSSYLTEYLVELFHKLRFYDNDDIPKIDPNRNTEQLDLTPDKGVWRSHILILARTPILIIQAVLRRWVILPALVILKNSTLWVIHGPVEWSQDWYELNQENYIGCSYVKDQLVDKGSLYENLKIWYELSEIKILSPFRLKPWKLVPNSVFISTELNSALPNKISGHSNQTSSPLEISFLTIIGQESEIPFGPVKAMPSFWRPLYIVVKSSLLSFFLKLSKVGKNTTSLIKDRLGISQQDLGAPKNSKDTIVKDSKDDLTLNAALYKPHKSVQSSSTSSTSLENLIKKRERDKLEHLISEGNKLNLEIIKSLPPRVSPQILPKIDFQPESSASSTQYRYNQLRIQILEFRTYLAKIQRNLLRANLRFQYLVIGKMLTLSIRTVSSSRMLVNVISHSLVRVFYQTYLLIKRFYISTLSILVRKIDSSNRLNNTSFFSPIDMNSFYNLSNAHILHTLWQSKYAQKVPLSRILHLWTENVPLKEWLSNTLQDKGVMNLSRPEGFQHHFWNSWLYQIDGYSPSLSFWEEVCPTNWREQVTQYWKQPEEYVQDLRIPNAKQTLSSSVQRKHLFYKKIVLQQAIKHHKRLKINSLINSYYLGTEELETKVKSQPAKQDFSMLEEVFDDENDFDFDSSPGYTKAPSQNQDQTQEWESQNEAIEYSKVPLLVPWTDLFEDNDEDFEEDQDTEEEIQSEPEVTHHFSSFQESESMLLPDLKLLSITSLLDDYTLMMYAVGPMLRSFNREQNGLLLGLDNSWHKLSSILKDDPSDLRLMIPQRLLQVETVQELDMLNCLELEAKSDELYNPSSPIPSAGYSNSFLVSSFKGQERDFNISTQLKTNLDRQHSNIPQQSAILSQSLWPTHRLEDLACMNRVWINGGIQSKISLLRLRIYPRLPL